MRNLLFMINFIFYGYIKPLGSGLYSFEEGVVNWVF